MQLRKDIHPVAARDNINTAVTISSLQAVRVIYTSNKGQEDSVG